MDLCFGERFTSVVVELDAQRYRVQVRHAAPFPGSGMPTPYVVIEHLVHLAVTTDNVMGADLGMRYRECTQGLLEAILGGVVDNHVVGLTQVEMDRPYPVCGVLRLWIY